MGWIWQWLTTAPRSHHLVHLLLNSKISRRILREILYITVVAQVYAPSSCTWTCAKNLAGVYPISPGYKPPPPYKNMSNTTSISAMIHKKHIYRFVVHTAVHSSTEKTTVFSGRLPAWCIISTDTKMLIFRKKSLYYPQKLWATRCIREKMTMC